MAFRHTVWMAAIAAAAVPAAFAGHEGHFEEVVVTGIGMDVPLTVVTDPQAPRQPLPAHDGADYLKTIPGFAVIRKGGADGDPVFRGMAGSRLSMMMDGELVLGGCGARMDPPTAYVFPAAYDRITVIKGPQTVLYGPGNSAGVVLFERERERRSEAGWEFNGSALGGNFDRNDAVLDISAGTPEFYLRGTGTHAHQGDYRDGDGTRVHSRYERWSAQAALGWTPDDDTLLEISGGNSDGEAAYADRSVDGSRFARDNLGVKLVLENLGPVLEKLEAQAYYNYIDHVMDNYSLRTPTGMMAVRSAMNPDRETTGGRLALTLKAGERTGLVLGMDTQANEHTGRMSMNQDMVRYQDLQRTPDASFQQVGVFGELTHALDERRRVVAGLRGDDWHAEDKRSTVALNMMMAAPNPTAFGERREKLGSGFLRYEHSLSSLPATAYVGVGRSARFPDYWELIAKESLASLSAFDADPEKTTQLDAGLVFRKGRLKGSVAAFYNRIDDYLLVQSGVEKPLGMMGTRLATVTRNIEARSWGAEADLAYALSDTWHVEASLAAVRGANDSDDTALAQMTPLEARLGLHYDNHVWSFGALWRVVAEQHRVDPGKGNIAGQDIGETAGFGVFSVNAGWRPHPAWLLTTGVDNLFDKTYAEHISRAGAMVAGFDQVARVNEPGRTLWLKAQFSFD